MQFFKKYLFYSQIILLTSVINIGCLNTDCSELDPTCNPFVAFFLYNIMIPTTQVTTGEFQTCIKLDDGSIRCWGAGIINGLGYNDVGNVGDGTGTSIIEAGDINIGGSVTQITAGNSHFCALLSDGKVHCWGNGTSGQLGYDNAFAIGDGTMLSIIQAGSVPIGENVTQITTGNSNTCAVLTTGALRCWGDGSNGQLGYDNTSNVGDGIGISIISTGNVPVGENAIQVGTGGTHTCALLVNGKVRCWGLGTDGQLGYNNPSPVGSGVISIIAAGDVPVGGNVKQIAVGANHTCALLETGSVRCWGDGANGQLGYNSTNDVGDAPIRSIINAGDVPIGETVIQISAANSSTCAVLSTGVARCWGNGANGKLGYGNTNPIGDGGGVTIISAGDIPLTGLGPVSQISTYSQHTCAIFSDKNIRCWGDGTLGRLGYNNTNPIGDTPGNSILNAGNVPVKADK